MNGGKMYIYNSHPLNIEFNIHLWRDEDPNRAKRTREAILQKELSYKSSRESPACIDME